MSRALVLAGLLCVLSLPSTALAQITEAEAECRFTIASSMAKTILTAQKAVVSCHKLRDEGLVAESDDCNNVTLADNRTGGKLAKTMLKTIAAVDARCVSLPNVLAEFVRCPAPAEDFDDTGTPAIDGFGEVTSCLFAHTLIGVERLDREVLGLPAAGLSPDALRCRKILTKGVTKLLGSTLKLRNKCQRALDLAGGPVSFACATADPASKLNVLSGKISEQVTAACGGVGVAAAVDSCSDFAQGIVDCAVLRAMPQLAGGLTSMLWELPGICPSSVDASVTAGDSDFDIGWKGLAADHVPPQNRYVVSSDLACDADCASCSPPAALVPDNCRCIGDSSVSCASNGDCASDGGLCQCHLAPPMPLSAGGTPYCVTTIENGDLEASLSPLSEQMTISGTMLQQVYLGASQAQPCPTCNSGFCSGGERHGLSCTRNGSDPSFGDVSLDCMPLSGAVLTNGLLSTLDLGTGSFSKGATLACDAPNELDSCPCSTCSLDNERPCSNDADCAAASAGVCRTDGAHGGPARKANDCTDGVCSPDTEDGDGEGVCSAGPVDLFCSAYVTAKGRGIIPCANDASCDAYDSICPASNCGSCSLEHPRDCFLDPVDAEGRPGRTLAGGGCISTTPTGLVSPSSTFGLPGPWRVRQGLRMDSYCSDGSTVFQAPGGSNCP